MNPWKRRFLLETIIFRFHVSFRGCSLKTIRVNLPTPRFTRRHCLVASHSLGATGSAHAADKIVVTWSRSMEHYGRMKGKGHESW